MKKLVACSLLLLAAVPAFARQSATESYLESLDASPTEEEDVIATEPLEDFLLLRVDLNRATLTDLLAIPGMTDAQAAAIIRHRDTFGPFLSLHELQVPEEIDSRDLQRLLPYLSLRQAHLLHDPRPFAERVRSAEKRLILRTGWRQERAVGYTEPGGYLGNGPALYARFLLRQPQDFSMGLAVEQDEGEPYGHKVSPSRPGVDQLSGHFMLENKGILKKVIVGDYRFHAGAGLVFGGGFPAGKWPSDLALLRPAAGALMPHSSGREGPYFRGAGTTLQKGAWTATAMASARHFDARLQQDSTGTYVTSFAPPGYHRTAAELERAGALPIYTGAADISFQPEKRPFRAGLTMGMTRLGHRWLPQSKVYDISPFTGDRWQHASLHYRGSLGRLYYYGEVASARPGGMGTLAGWLYSFSKTESLAIIGRHYEKSFHSYYGRAFGENSRNRNETGLYMAFQFSPYRKIHVLLGADHFIFPHIQYRTYSPSEGREYTVQVRRESRTLMYSLSLRDKIRPRNNTGSEGNAYQTVPFRKHQLALQLKYSPKNSLLDWHSRLYYNRSSNGGSGFGMAQDIQATLGRWALSGRIALFDTETFDNRLYMYERDVWGTFSIPMYYGQGMRTYWMVRYKASRQLSIWARMGRFRYRDKEQTGTGAGTILEDTRTDFRLQLSYRWW